MHIFTLIFAFNQSFCTFFTCELCLQGIEWTNIEYFNNAVICDLMENVSGPEIKTLEDDG